MGRLESQSTRRRTRRDGWTAERQLAFLAALTRTRSVTMAARAVGMSRESAYRLRGRPTGALFAAAWDGALKFVPTPVKVHIHAVAGTSERRRRTLLNRHFSRKSAEGHEQDESDYPPGPPSPRWLRPRPS